MAASSALTVANSTPAVQGRYARNSLGDFLVALNTTRSVLLLALCSIIAGLGLYGWNAYAASRYYADVVKAIGISSGPSIVATSRMRSQLVAAGTALSTSYLKTGNDRELLLNQYTEGMESVNSSLISTALNITYGQEEREPLYQLMGAIAEYERLAGAALRSSGPAAVERLGEAEAQLQSRVLPEVSELEKVNSRNLSTTLSRHLDTGRHTKATLAGSTAMLVLLLVLTQLYLARRFRRLLSIPLCLLTGALLCYFGLAWSTMSTIDRELQTSKEGSFDVAHLLIGLQAGALDLQHAERLALATAVKPTQQNPDDEQHARSLVDSLTKLALGEEMTAHLTAFTSYRQELRAALAGGERDRAVQLSLGRGPNQGDWAFNQMEVLLKKAISTFQSKFDDSVTRCVAKVSQLPGYLIAMELLGLILTLLAFKPRLDEFHF
jgi:hypothetical protein